MHSSRSERRRRKLYDEQSTAEQESKAFCVSWTVHCRTDSDQIRRAKQARASASYWMVRIQAGGLTCLTVVPLASSHNRAV